MNSPISLGKRLSFVLVALFCCFSAHAQKHISGTVTDKQGTPIFKANVMEIDKTHRILNQTTTDKQGNFVLAVNDALNGYLRISANGFILQREHIRRNSQKFNIKMEIRKASRLSLIQKQATGKKPRVFRSKQLLCGRSGMHMEPWTVQVERLTDTLYVLQLPVKAENLSGTYKEGRSITFLDNNDYQITMCYNGEDAVAITGNPDFADLKERRDMQNIGNFQLRNGSDSQDSNEPIYYYPQFILTQDDIDILLAQSDRLARVAVDTEAGDNYWLVYPLESFSKELKKAVTKLNKK